MKRLLSSLLLAAFLVIPAAAQNINFGPDAVLDTATYPEFTGYLGDDGSAYGDRGNGFTYGWLDSSLDPDDQFESRNRNNADSANELFDTTNHMIKGDGHSWQIDIPNGDYNVTLIAGDANHTDQINNLSVSGGASALSIADPDGESNFDEYNFSYSVSSGYLRLSPDPIDDLSMNQKISHLSISIVPEPTAAVLAACGAFALLGVVRRRRK